MAEKTDSNPTKTSKAKEASELSQQLHPRLLTRNEQLRLPSLRGPRDLTLGGVKKKTFTPNIPVRRVRTKAITKEEAKPVKETKTKRDWSSRGGRNRGRGRGGAHRAGIIQSHSIFEAGPSAEGASRGRGSQLSAGASSSAQLKKPTIKKEHVDVGQEKIDSDATMRRLEDGNASFITDVQNDDKLKPTTLPLFSDVMKSIKQETDGSNSPPGIPRPSDCASVFRNEHNMFLLQLPDTIPGIPLSTDNTTTSASVKQEPGVSTKNDVSVDAKVTSHKYSLDELSAGRIGKLQVLKSGKCRLVLGNVALNLRMGTTSSFAEEIVSIRLPPEGSPDSAVGHVTVLGNVDHKLICTPNIEMLLK